MDVLQGDGRGVQPKRFVVTFPGRGHRAGQICLLLYCTGESAQPKFAWTRSMGGVSTGCINLRKT